MFKKTSQGNIKEPPSIMINYLWNIENQKTQEIGTSINLCVGTLPKGQANIAGYKHIDVKKNVPNKIKEPAYTQSTYKVPWEKRH